MSVKPKPLTVEMPNESETEVFLHRIGGVYHAHWDGSWGYRFTPFNCTTGGVWGEIQCTGLTVVDMSGTPAIVLRTDETLGNGIVLHNPAGMPAVLFVTDETGNSVAVVDKSGESAVLLRTSELANVSSSAIRLGKMGFVYLRVKSPIV